MKNLKKIGEPFVKVHKKVEKKHGAELKKEPKEISVKVEISDKFKNFLMMMILLRAILQKNKSFKTLIFL